MAIRQEIEFIILPDGNVQLTVKGARGAQCVPIGDLFKVLGETATEQSTSEFYDREDEQTMTVLT